MKENNFFQRHNPFHRRPSMEQIRADIERWHRESAERPKPKAIGYLVGPDYERGIAPEGFVEKLLEVEGSFESIRGSAGHHECEYCPIHVREQRVREFITLFSEGKREESNIIRRKVWSSNEYILNDKYIWPEMLQHYIEDHEYLPPQDFIDTILTYKPPEKTSGINLPKFEF